METPVYISGPMTGIKNSNKKAFMAAEKYLMRTFKLKKDQVVNPVRIGRIVEHTIKGMYNRKPTWEEYMAQDVLHLMQCLSIFYLPGCSYSKGAQYEARMAKALSLHEYGMPPK